VYPLVYYIGRHPLQYIVADDMIDRMSDLSPLLYDTLLDVAVNGLTPEQSAEEQGVSANVIYQRIHRAKEILSGKAN